MNKPLSELLQTTKTVNPRESPDSEFDYIDVSSVSNQKFRIETTQRLRGSSAPSRARRLVEANDVLFATIRPTLRRIAIVPQDLHHQICSTGYFVLRPKPEIDHRFMFHWLFSESFTGQMEKLQKGASYPAVTDAEVRAQEIAYPPLHEQQRIVRILDEAFDGIARVKASVEKNFENARALFERHLEIVFSNPGTDWTTKRISEVATHSLGKMLDKSKNKGEPQPYLRNLNVRWFEFDLSDLLKMRFLPEETAKYTARRGDVLVCEGGYPGRAAIWDQDDSIFFQKALHRVRFHCPGHNRWFVYYLYAQDKNGSLRNRFSGTGIQHFTGEALARFQVPLPPLAQLQLLLSRFEELQAETERLRRVYEQKLAALDSLKQSLLHQAFSGAL